MTCYNSSLACNPHVTPPVALVHFLPFLGVRAWVRGNGVGLLLPPPAGALLGLSVSISLCSLLCCLDSLDEGYRGKLGEGGSVSQEAGKEWCLQVPLPCCVCPALPMSGRAAPACGADFSGCLTGALSLFCLCPGLGFLAHPLCSPPSARLPGFCLWLHVSLRCLSSFFALLFSPFCLFLRLHRVPFSPSFHGPQAHGSLAPSSPPLSRGLGALRVSNPAAPQWDRG